MTERRQTTRQDCELPLNIIQVGSTQTDWLEQALNISSNGGVCFHSFRPLIPGEKVRYILTLSQAGPSDIRLVCSGEIVRRRPVSSGFPGAYEIAMTMERYRFAGQDFAKPSAEFVQERTPELRPEIAQIAG
jgi:hypothetical protein